MSSLGKRRYQAGPSQAGKRARTAGRRARAPPARFYSQPMRGNRLKGITETKYVDGYLDSTAVHDLGTNDNTWADCELNPRQQTAVYGCLPVPQQGTNYSDRDGRKIFIKNIKIRGTVWFKGINNMTAAQDQAYVRLVVVKDTRTNGVALSAEDVLGPGLGSDGNAALTADAAVNAMTNPDGWGRYKIMKDKFIRAPPQSCFQDGTNGEMQGFYMPFKMTIRCNCYVNFDATTGAVGSIIDNSFHLLAGASAGFNDINVSYLARTAFVG